MRGHSADQIFDELVWDERMAEVEFGDIGL